MKIAVLEDDPVLHKHICILLQKQGWQTTSLKNLAELQALLLTAEDVDLFLLDRMIGQEDSVHWLHQIKSVKPFAKILILSSVNNPEERAKWLFGGADEYMGKPVFTDELVARIHHLMKRQNIDAISVLNRGDLKIDKFKRTASFGLHRLDLTSKEFGLLVLLCENPGRVFSKLQILEHLWDVNSDVETNVVESTINHLRRKIEASGSRMQIQSKRNMGYWIEA